MKSTILIEKYLDGTLKSDKLKDFERYIKSSEELKERVILHKEVNESVELDDITIFRKKLRSIYFLFRKWENNEVRDPSIYISQPAEQRLLVRHRWLIAASISLIVIIGALFMYISKDRAYTNDKLFSMYYQPYMPDIYMRSDSHKINELGNAISLYDQYDYQRASKELNLIIAGDNNNFLAKYYLGLTCMGLGKYDTAIREFEFLRENWESSFIYHTEWYLALCYLKSDNKKKAIILLKKIRQDNRYYSDKARILLEKLS